MQRTLLSVCLLLVIAIPCQAQGEKPKPNTLTPKEIADGWILLFDGETTFGWQLKSPTAKNSLKVTEHTLDLNGVKENAYLTSRVPDFELQFEYHIDGGVAHVGVENTPKE